MKYIFGLGNPTKEYVGTRHNIGFDAITKLSDVYGIRVEEKKHKALCGKGIIGGQRVMLIKPQTYMNLSGESVVKFVQLYKLKPNQGLVIKGLPHTSIFVVTSKIIAIITYKIKKIKYYFKQLIEKTYYDFTNSLR